MEKLIHGLHKFEANVFRTNLEFFQRLNQGQNPQALFITCSDSRVVPELITQTDPGDLFVLRNAGNIVPGYSSVAGAEAAAIEFAVRGLKVRDVVICGHTRCGAMKALLSPEDLRDMPRVREWLRHADASKEVVQAKYAHLEGEARWKVMAEENVLTQLENLRTHPAVAVGLSSGELKLHGWVYKMETGQVFTYQPESGQFVPLATASGTPTVRRLAISPHARGEDLVPAAESV